jgi:hypothetical protein
LILRSFYIGCGGVKWAGVAAGKNESGGCEFVILCNEGGGN